MLMKTFSLLFFGVGIFLLVQLAMPFLAFKFWEYTSFNQSAQLIDPRLTAQTTQTDGQVLGVNIENIGDFPAFISMQKIEPPFREFSLTVPKVGLKDIKALVYSNKFEDNLGHLPGSALPGEKGNVFITGHSSLPNVLLTKGQKAFFIDLPKIKKGDEIFIDVLGQRFTYQVIGLKIIDPKDISVINPPDKEGRYLTLMTCVPPGFNIKRLIVLAKLK